MSRIYEAMKKAGVEVGAQTSEWEPAPKVQDVTVAGSIPPAATSSVANAGPLTFDDLQSRCAHPVWNPDVNLNVFSNPALAFGAEQFRTLRSRLYQIRDNQALRIILVTSSMAGEGKTFVASNLAQAIVRQPNCRALLIDADLRCSRLHLMLGTPTAPGLSDYLQGSADECAIVQSEQENNLYFIPGGNGVTNPSELLANGRLKGLFNRIAPAFDWVIVDSPPCLALADASVLAEFCDGVILVARAGSTPGEAAHRACKELQARKTVLGVVLNAVKEGSGPYDVSEKRRQADRAKQRPIRNPGNGATEPRFFGIVRRKNKDG